MQYNDLSELERIWDKYSAMRVIKKVLHAENIYHIIEQYKHDGLLLVIQWLYTEKLTLRNCSDCIVVIYSF
jgi:hypothetical protein